MNMRPDSQRQECEKENDDDAISQQLRLNFNHIL